MKKNVYLALALAMAFFMLVACNKSNSTTATQNRSASEGNGGNSNSNTTVNWQQEIKETFGFDLTNPTGWTFKELHKVSGSRYVLQFTTTGNDFDAEYKTFVEYIFNLTKSITPSKGNYDGNLMNDYTGDKITEIPKGLTPSWMFDTQKYAIEVMFSADQSGRVVQMEFYRAKYV